MPEGDDFSLARRGRERRDSITRDDCQALAARGFGGIARQRLIALKPAHCWEAEKKVPNVIAATVTGTMELRLDQIATIGKSVAVLKPEVRELLHTRKR